MSSSLKRKEPSSAASDEPGAAKRQMTESDKMYGTVLCEFQVEIVDEKLAMHEINRSWELKRNFAGIDVRGPPEEDTRTDAEIKEEKWKFLVDEVDLGKTYIVCPRCPIWCGEGPHPEDALGPIKFKVVSGCDDIRIIGKNFKFNLLSEHLRYVHPGVGERVLGPESAEAVQERLLGQSADRGQRKHPGWRDTYTAEPSVLGLDFKLLQDADIFEVDKKYGTALCKMCQEPIQATGRDAFQHLCEGSHRHNDHHQHHQEVFKKYHPKVIAENKDKSARDRAEFKVRATKGAAELKKALDKCIQEATSPSEYSDIERLIADATKTAATFSSSGVGAGSGSSSSSQAYPACTSCKKNLKYKSKEGKFNRFCCMTTNCPERNKNVLLAAV